MKNSPYENELKALEEALQKLADEVSGLRVNPVRLPEAQRVKAVAWQIEDAKGQKVFVSLSGSLQGDAKRAPQNATDVVFSVEAEVGQFLELDSQNARVFLELNYTEMNLAKIALTPDQRLVVVHRRWFEELTLKAAFDAVAEVWNTAQNLNDTLQPKSPGHA